MVEHVVIDYLQANGRSGAFPSSRPGKDWWRCFLRRWPSLVERRPQHLPSLRAKAVTEAAVDAWLGKVTAKFTELKLNDLAPEELGKRLWNCDETAFATDVASQRIFAKRVAKNVHETGGGTGREYITVLGCGSANGERLPPYIVYKGKNLWSNWTVGGPAGALYNTSQSGWMEQHHFLEWFKKMFLPAVTSLLETGPVVLFVDGHISHVSLDLIQLAKEKGVTLFCLPSHTTHVLQPLDVAVYGPVKKSWKKILKEYKMETCAAKVDKTVFPSLIRKLWDESFQPDHLKAGFKRAGLCPVSKDAIPKSSYAPSLMETTTTTTTPTPTVQATDCDSQDHTVHVQVSCCECFRQTHITPVRIYLRGYFSNLIGKKQEEKKTERRKVKSVYSGEALTSDDMIARLEDEDRERKENAAAAEKKREEKAAAAEKKREEKEKKREEKEKKREEKEKKQEEKEKK